MSMRNTKHVVLVSSNVVESCEHCSQRVGGEELFQDSVNHYLVAHGYKLLHVGAETTTDSDARPWHVTIAVLGSNRKRVLIRTGSE
jgi:hypothetical protein